MDFHINYKIKGKGNPVVLLHGWGQTIVCWYDLAEELSKNFKVIILDLPGFGRSFTPEKPYDIGDYVRVVNSLLNKLKIHSPVIIGHSFGAAVAYYYSHLFKCRKCILISFVPGGKEFLQHFFKIFYPAPQVLYLLFSHLAHPTSYKNYVDLNYRRSRIMLQTYIKSIDLKLPEKIANEIYVFYGQKDKFLSSQAVENFEKKYSGDFQLIPIEKAGHYPFIENRSGFLTNLMKIL